MPDRYCLVCRTEEETLEHFFLACKFSDNVFSLWNTFCRTVLGMSMAHLSVSHRGILLPPFEIAKPAMIYIAGCWTLWRLTFQAQRRWIQPRIQGSPLPSSSFWVQARLAISSLLHRWGLPLRTVELAMWKLCPEELFTVRARRTLSFV